MVLSWTGPSAHGAEGRQEEGLQGALSAALPWSLPGLGAWVAVLLPAQTGGPRGHTTRVTAPFGRGRGGQGSAGGCLASRGRPQLNWSARGCAGLGVCDEVGGARAHLEVP